MRLSSIRLYLLNFKQTKDSFFFKFMHDFVAKDNFINKSYINPTTARVKRKIKVIIEENN